MKCFSAYRLALALLAAVPVSAPAAAPEPPPQRSTNLTVYGDDPCPAGEGDEIVVCARRPEGERYRIPKELRHKNDAPLETGWGARALGLDEASADTRPDSCSVVGSYGQTGCFAEMLSRWRAERRQMRTTP